MLFSKTPTLEDHVVELLANSRSTLKSIHSRLLAGDKITLRAVYKVVHKLIKAGVLLKVGQYVLVDQEWARRAREMLSSAPPLLPAVGERAVFSFTSIDHLDTFWKTVVLPLERFTSAHEIFFYNPHDFWAYLSSRKDSEEAYYRHFSDTINHGFFTVGGNSMADMDFKREYQSDHLQIDLREMSLLKRTDHITVVGSMIISVRIGKAMASHIDSLYASGRGIKDILPEIERVCQKPGKIRFVLENDTEKAQKLRKLLSRNFYFKQPD